MKKFKNGSSIIVISGKSKGLRGTVVSVYPRRDRVIVEGLNIMKKHIKPNPNKGIDGGICKKEASIHISNIALYNSSITSNSVETKSDLIKRLPLDGSEQ